MYTRFDATEYVITHIEASGVYDRAEYDVDAIVTELYEMMGTYDFDDHGPDYFDEFWNAVSNHAL